MKKNLLLYLVLAFWAATGCFTTCYSSPGNLAALVPGDTEILVTFRSLESFYAALNVNSTSVMGDPVDDLETITAQLGFNPLVISDLKNAGFDPGQSFGIALRDFVLPEKEEDEPSANLAIVLPVKDSAKAGETVRKFLEKASPGIIFSQKGNLTIFRETPEGGDSGAIVARDGYLLLGINMNEARADITAFMKAIAEARSPLEQEKIYKDAAGKLKSGGDMTAYADFRSIIKRNRAALEQMRKESGAEELSAKEGFRYLDDYEGGMAAVDFSGSDLSATGVLNIAPASELFGIMKDVRFDRNTALGISDLPVLLFSSAFNPEVWYKGIRKKMAPEEAREIDQNLASVKKQFNVDLEKDVIPNFDGNFNIGIYDGLTINMANYNVLITAGVRDAAAAQAMLKKAVAGAPAEAGAGPVFQPVRVGETDAYMANMFGMVQIFAGIRDKTLIIAAGKPLFEKALAAKPDSGFVKKLGDPKLEAGLKAEKSVFYLNMGETMNVMKNFAMMIQQFSGQNPVEPETEKALREIDYLFSSYWPEGNTFYSDFRIKTRFTKPFPQRMAEIARMLEPPDTPEKSEMSDETDGAGEEESGEDSGEEEVPSTGKLVQ